MWSRTLNKIENDDDDEEGLKAVAEALEIAKLVASGTGAEKHFEGVA